MLLGIKWHLWFSCQIMFNYECVNPKIANINVCKEKTSFTNLVKKEFLGSGAFIEFCSL